MKNKEILEECEIARKKGFGNYFIAPNLTWNDLENGLINGAKLSQEYRRKVEDSIESLKKSRINCKKFETQENYITKNDNIKSQEEIDEEIIKEHKKNWKEALNVISPCFGCGKEYSDDEMEIFFICGKINTIDGEFKLCPECKKSQGERA